MSRAAANIVSAQVILFPKSVLGLATGDTPIGMYRQLIEWHRKGDLDFSQVRTVNLDEYVGLSRDHDKSYNWFMWHHLFSQINVPPGNIFLPDGLAGDPAAECRRYEDNIRALGGIDLQVLGIGHNGHIGFNEPGPVFTKSTHVVTLSEQTLSANARFFDSYESMPRQAITMGMGTIMAGKEDRPAMRGRGQGGDTAEGFAGGYRPHGARFDPAAAYRCDHRGGRSGFKPDGSGRAFK